MRMFGLAIDHEAAFFAIARSAGWVAHGATRLGSADPPRARYVGGRQDGEWRRP